jgi:hypothetical protein
MSLLLKPIRRIAIAVPKGTGRRGVGRRTTGLLGDGSRRKDKAGDEPPGCTSIGALGAREPRNDEGSRPLGRLGIFCGDLLARFAIRCPHVRKSPSILQAYNSATMLEVKHSLPATH